MSAPKNLAEFVSRGQAAQKAVDKIISETKHQHRPKLDTMIFGACRKCGAVACYQRYCLDCKRPYCMKCAGQDIEAEREKQTA